MLKKIGIIVLNLVVMLLIVLGGTLLWIPGWLNDLTGHDNRVVVPSVIGQVADSAVLRLTDAGLNPMVIDTIYSDGRQPGEVIDQLPEGNLPVKVVFPDVIQWSSRQAQSYLRELRFVADSIVYEPYDFDDLVLSVTALKGRKKEMEVGELYPVRTHVVLHVGSTKTAMEAQNEATEKSFFE